MGGFPGRGDHSQSDVAFVSNMTLTVEGCEEFGSLMAFASCTLPADGFEIQARCPARVQATCRFTPRRVVLA